MTLNIILATNTPGKTLNWLLDRGIFQLKDDGNGGQVIVARNRDIRFTYNQIPNPINSWNMYAMRFVRSEFVSDQDEIADETIPGDETFQKSKWIKWLKNNGTRVDFDWEVRKKTIDPETGDIIEGDIIETIPLVAYRVDFDGGQFYVMKEHPKIHQWQ